MLARRVWRAFSAATVGDGEAAAAREEPTPSVLPHARLWGPVLAAEAHSVGALTSAASVLIRPSDTCMNIWSMFARVRALLPEGIYPRSDDTAVTLARRLGESAFLDDIHFPRGGHGAHGRFVRLNATPYPQPRRVTGSEEAAAAHLVPSVGWVQPLYAYTQARRPPQDWRCRPMPPELSKFKDELWRLALPYLGPVSARSPPNACQLMLYYVLFGSAIGRHRDNYCTADLLRALEPSLPGKDNLSFDGHTASGDTNSQVVHSDVLVWSDGDSMTLTLSFPPPHDPTANRDDYVVHPEFRVRCGAGTLFVFRTPDDLFFCHEAAFDDAVAAAAGAAGYRFAYVFRWLQSVRDFHLDPTKRHGMLLTHNLEQAAKERRASKAKKRARECATACAVGRP